MDTLLPTGSGTTIEWSCTPAQTHPNEWLNTKDGLSAPTDSSYVSTDAIDQIYGNKLGQLSFSGPIGTLTIAFRYAGEESVTLPTGPAGEFHIFLDGVDVVNTKRFALDTEGTITTGVAVFTPSDFTGPFTNLTGAIWNAATERRIRIVSKLADKSQDGDVTPSPHQG